MACFWSQIYFYSLPWPCSVTRRELLSVLHYVRDGVPETVLSSQLPFSDSRQSSQTHIVMVTIGPSGIYHCVNTSDILLLYLQYKTLNINKQ